MATTKKATTKTKSKIAEPIEIVGNVPTVDKKPEIHEPRKFGATDPVECESIVAGELGMIGIKSGINYRWAERGDITEVEYQDLVAAIRSHESFIEEPYFIIRDEEFLEQYKNVRKIYETMYSIGDLENVLKLSERSMKATILSLPEGARNSIKNIASTQIANGTLDSVRKIKILDEIFDTKMMLMTELFDDYNE